MATACIQGGRGILCHAVDEWQLQLIHGDANSSHWFWKVGFPPDSIPDFVPSRFRVDSYYHTSFALVRRDGGVDITEVQKVNNIFKYIKRGGLEAMDE